ncbi:MAG TPA: PIN domain-containing protein [Gemmata sp.]|jgi:hypothetical protein|nr:PIN domain-containing protein [Gemmata sp.]
MTETSIADAVAHILGQTPASVVLVDTCSLLDLFRRDESRPQRRVVIEEIQAATFLLELVTSNPNSAHLFVPELIPKEFEDHANRTETSFRSWTKLHDDNQKWLVEAFGCFSVPLPAALSVANLNLAAKLRSLANNLFAKAIILKRDQTCLDKAVERLINKTRPSHDKEMKDSMNIEQCLELSRRLQQHGFPSSRVWISSNTKDFAETSNSSVLHPELHDDFNAVGLKYFTSLREAFFHLRSKGEIL